jgi:ribosomal protein S18 acetylase RimI-like enzyme
MIETRDQGHLEAILRREPAWAGYALGDLDEPHFSRSRWILSDPAGTGLVLDYRVGEWCTLITLGQGRVAAEVLAAMAVPARFDVHYPVAHERWVDPLLDGPRARYVRMAAAPAELRPVPVPSGVSLRRLTPQDAPSAERLYLDYPANAYSPHRLAEGAYVGAELDGELVGVAGTHVANPRTRVAALGDIVTARAHRGLGIGALLTHHLAAILAREADLLVLNVAEANEAARRAYQKVGFVDACLHWEGTGVVRR